MKTIFSPYENGTVLASLFTDIINIWDINSYHYINNIYFDKKLKRSSNLEIKWSQSGKYLIFQRYKNLIEIFSLLLNKLEYSIESGSNDYFFKEQEKKIILYEKGSIFVYDITSNNKLYKIKCDASSCEKSFFDENNSLFYILNDGNIFIYDLLLNKKIFENHMNKCTNFILLKDNNDEEKLLTKIILCLNDKKFEILSIYKENYQNINESNEEIASNDFWKKSIKKIDDNYEFLSYKYNKYEDEEIRPKNYISIKEIDQESDYLLKNTTLEEKRELVKNNNINFTENDDIEITYINYIKNLIKDNTNTKLLINYLSFLQKNNNKLQTIYGKDFENYNDEIAQFQVCFSQSLLNERLKYTKIKSEKEKLIDLLDNILKINDFDDLQKLINQEKEEFDKFQFNQPISFENKDLFICQNKQVIFYSIKDILIYKETDLLEKMKYCIKRVLDENLLDDPNIFNDYLKITLIFILISLPQKKAITDYNLNLINDDKNNVYENDLIDLGFKYKKNYDAYEYENKDIFIKKKDIPLLNKNNLELFINDESLKEEDDNDEFQIYELYKYNYMMDYYKNHFDENKVREFISNILISNVIKEAFHFFYGNEIKYPFSDDLNKKAKDKALEFVNKYLKFIPFKFEDTSAVTNKFTMETFIFLNSKIFPIKFKKSQKLKIDCDLISKALINGVIIIINDHEINHNFHNYYYFSQNGKECLKTPRKKNSDNREVGFNMENILFGKILNNLTLRQTLYILNEENYKKSLYQYRLDFLQLKNEDCDCKGTFKDYSTIKIENLGKFSDYTVIRFKSDLYHVLSLPIHLKNDVLGFRSFHLNY